MNPECKWWYEEKKHNPKSLQTLKFMFMKERKKNQFQNHENFFGVGQILKLKGLSGKGKI